MMYNDIPLQQSGLMGRQLQSPGMMQQPMAGDQMRNLMLAQALMGQRQPQNLGQGIGAIGPAIMQALMARQGIGGGGMGFPGI